MRPAEVLQGSLEDTPFAEVLVQLCLEDASGILTLTDGRVVKKVCLMGGRVRFVASNIREDRLAEQLLAQGRIDEKAYATLTAESKRDLRMGRRAVQLLGMSEVEVADGLREQIRETLVPCFDWIQGQYRFEEGWPDLGDEIEVSLLPADLALAWAREDAGDPTHADSILGGGERRLKSMPGAFERAEIMALEPVEGYLLSMANGERSNDELVASCPVAPEVASRALFVILRAGILAPRLHVEELEESRATREAPPVVPPTARPPVTGAAPVEPTPAPEAPEATAAPTTPEPPLEISMPDREETFALLSRVEAEDLFEVLGLEQGADAAAVREAYFSLARRFHPDRHREGELSELHPRLEGAFARLTVAYSTLSDSEAREAYLGRGAAEPDAATPDPTELAAVNHRRGLEVYRSGKRVEALAFLENAVRLDPKPAAYHRDLGLLQAQNPRLRREAPESLRAALDRDPTDVTARVGLALVLLRVGQEKDARSELKEAARWEPDHPALQAALGKGAVSPALRAGLLGPLLRG